MFDPLTAGLPPPGPPGLRPPPLPLRLGGSPATAGQTEGAGYRGKKEVYQTMGERLAAGKVDGWVTRNGARKRGVRVIHAGTPKGRGGGAKAPVPVFSSRVEDLLAGGGEATPRAPQGSRLSEGKCSESTYRRKWQNGAMAHFALLRVQKLKSAVAVHRSMKHSFRAQDTPNADAELSHSTSISARTAWPRAWPHSGRDCRRASVRMLSRLSST